MSLIGLDVGTTGCKAVGFDEHGRELAQAYREYPLLHPQPGWSELSTATIWSAVQAVLARVARTIGTSDPPQAISVSCQGEAVAPIAQDGQALSNFSVSFDDRTIPQYHWWLEQVSKNTSSRLPGCRCIRCIPSIK